MRKLAYEQEVNLCLDLCARKGICIYYADLESMVAGLSRGSPDLSLILGRRMEADFRSNLPFAPAMLVNQETGRPSSGFFAKAKELGFAFESEVRFWSDQVHRLRKLTG